jgi:2,3-bisphosphoglycerate-independent phosphoglycerate mutase
MGIELADQDVAYRCNLVTLRTGEHEMIMEDYSAGHISSEEAGELIRSIDEKLGTDAVKFFPGVSYRHLMVWNNGHADVNCTPPHDITGKPIAGHLPKGKGEEILRELMHESVGVLSDHRINRERVKNGKRPANSIWFWGQGRRPLMPEFKDKYSVTGSLISAVDLTKGLGIYAGFRIINVPGATGYLDTNYKGKAEYGIESLKESDFVYIHIEAPDEAGHNGNLTDKIRAIEDIDAKVLGPVLKAAGGTLGEFRVLLMPDHATPLEVRTHTDDYIPFVIYDSSDHAHSSGVRTYDEEIVRSNSVLTFREGYTLMDFFIRGSRKE